MPSASAAQIALPLSTSPEELDAWVMTLIDAFADRQRKSGFLPLAEEALRAHPGDPVILCLAATAALLDEEPQRALVFLKRYSKRCVPAGSYHLLHALALAQENKLDAAHALLERHGLTSPYQAMRAFPGGWARTEWLSERLGRISQRNKLPARKRSISEADRVRARSSAKSRPAERPRKAPSSPAAQAPAAAAGLPRIEIDIPFAVELDLAPLLAATKTAPEHDGGWYQLRERFAHLGLAQGFDELLCLPHLQWHRNLLCIRSRPCARCSSNSAAACCWPTKWGSARPSRPAWC